MSVRTMTSARRERGAELVQQLLGAAVAMRLEHRHHAPIDPRLGGGENGGDLGRVMAVVVHDQHAVTSPRVWKRRSAPRNSAERRGDRSERHTEFETDGRRRERVEQVVTARHVQARASPRVVVASVRTALHDRARRAEGLQAHVEADELGIVRDRR